MRISGWLMVIIVALVIMAAAGAAVLTVSWIGPVGSGPIAVGAGGGMQDGRERPAAMGPVFDAGGFTVNLAGAGRAGGFLRASLALEVDGRKALEELQSREPQVRDAIIVALRSFTPAELKEEEGIHRLKARIQNDVSQMMAEGEVRHVYFKELITQ